MGKKLFVTGLSYNITDEQLKECFTSAGTVESAKVIIDHDTGKSKGFGFIEMSSSKEADQATKTLNGFELDGRALVVKEARPKGERPSSGGFGGGGGNGYGNNDKRGYGNNNDSKNDKRRWR